jgi:hypothetical protein
MGRIGRYKYPTINTDTYSGNEERREEKIDGKGRMGKNDWEREEE